MYRARILESLLGHTDQRVSQRLEGFEESWERERPGHAENPCCTLVLACSKIEHFWPEEAREYHENDTKHIVTAIDHAIAFIVFIATCGRPQWS